MRQPHKAKRRRETAGVTKSTHVNGLATSIDAAREEFFRSRGMAKTVFHPARQPRRAQP